MIQVEGCIILYMEENDKSLLHVLLVYFVLTLSFIVLNIKRQVKVYSSSAPTLIPIMSLTNQVSNLPQIAYLEYNYIGEPDAPNNNPELGSLFILSVDGSSKRQIAHFDQEVFQDSSGNLNYSPVTQEIFINTDHGIVGTNVQTKAQRTVYPGSTQNLAISDDGQWIYFTPGSPNSPYDSQSEPMQIKININPETVQTQPKGDCDTKYQPYFNSETNTYVDIKSKDIEITPAGQPFAGQEVTTSNTIKVCRPTGDKTYTFNHPTDKGDINPLVLTKQYLYFRIFHYGSDDFQAIRKLYKLNLATGVVSDWQTNPSTYELMQLTNTPGDHDAVNLGLADRGKYYLYSLMGKYYKYDIQNQTISPFTIVSSYLGWKKIDPIFLLLTNTNETVDFDLRNNEYARPNIPHEFAIPINDL